MTRVARLIDRLTPTSRSALERAAERCRAQTHSAVEIEHLMGELASDPGSDLARAVEGFGIDRAQLAVGLAAAAARYSVGSTVTPGLSAPLVKALEAAWVISSIDLSLSHLNSACLLQAAIEDGRARETLMGAAPELASIPRQQFAESLAGLVASGRESRAAPSRGPALGGTDAAAIDRYTVDLTAQARAGALDPVVGRDEEVAKLVEILLRRRQNNPILAGDAGVGKTAIVEGLAQRIADGEAPEPLAGVSIRSLDLGALLAGAGARGELEQRMRSILDAVAGDPAGIILFIDEAHALLGGSSEAANLLKPALARGGLRVIAATTWSEYKRYIEKDAAFARRFQPIRVEPPSPAATVSILRRLASGLEDFHAVRITESALAAAAWLSQRYIPDRQLPDKALGVLDAACARVAIARTSQPRALAAAEQRCRDLALEAERLSDVEPGAVHGAERREAVAEARAAAQDERDRLASLWAQERRTVERIQALERILAEGPNVEAEGELGGLNLELAEIQQDAPLIPLAVDRRAVADVVSAWTGVPLDAILGAAPANALELKARLSERIVGQDAALDTITRRIQTFYADLGDPGKPTGVFLLCGPSGVGKTETALALAELLYGGPRALITVNMSEYQEAHSVSGLKGAPPGYVGYGKGGVLTEAVRRRPYSVVLLDEVDKAHADVLEVFYQVFDRGVLDDSEGVAVDFTNTLILLTANIGSDTMTAWRGRTPPPSATDLAAALRPELLRHFAPAFLGRLVVVPYAALGPREVEAVVRLKLGRIQQRFAETRGSDLTYDEAVVHAIARQAGVNDGGARSVDAIINHQVLPQLSGQLLDSLADGSRVTGAHIGLVQGRLHLTIDR